MLVQLQFGTYSWTALRDRQNYLQLVTFIIISFSLYNVQLHSFLVCVAMDSMCLCRAYCNLDIIDLLNLSNDDLTEEESHITQRTIERTLQNVE